MHGLVAFQNSFGYFSGSDNKIFLHKLTKGSSDQAEINDMIETSSASTNALIMWGDQLYVGDVLMNLKV